MLVRNAGNFFVRSEFMQWQAILHAEPFTCIYHKLFYLSKCFRVANVVLEQLHIFSFSHFVKSDHSSWFFFKTHVFLHDFTKEVVYVENITSYATNSWCIEKITDYFIYSSCWKIWAFRIHFGWNCSWLCAMEISDGIQILRYWFRRLDGSCVSRMLRISP